MEKSIKPIRNPHSPTPIKPIPSNAFKRGPWKPLGVAYTFQKLDRVLGLDEYELPFLLAADQRRQAHR